MKLAPLFAAAFSLFPALALACPSSASGAACGTALGQYVSTFGIGLLAGIGSIAVESAIRARRKR